MLCSAVQEWPLASTDRAAAQPLGGSLALALSGRSAYLQASEGVAMDNGFQFFDILLFAAVAGFLLLRLRSVLGRRTGNERRRGDPYSAPRSPVVVPPR